MARRAQTDSAVYKEAIKSIKAGNLPFLVGGAWAVSRYTNQPYKLNDLDLFCKAGDYPKILDLLSNFDFKPHVTDEKWVGKALKGSAQVDLIFSSPNGVNMVDDSWFSNGRPARLLNQSVNIIGPEELIWTKLYIHKATRFDGADINHLILKLGDELDWRTILRRMEAHWELLLSALINYRFVYPSERGKVPDWLMKELLDRLRLQLKTPTPQDRITRGPLVSSEDYHDDILKGGFGV